MHQSLVVPRIFAQAFLLPRRPRRHRMNTKRRGEISEAALFLKAVTQGFAVAKPWGDNERYDLILDSGERLWRVQLKSTRTLRAGGYDVQPIYSIYGHGKRGYTPDQIDVLIVHIVPRDLWYVLPVAAYSPSKSLRFYPDATLSPTCLLYTSPSPRD